MNCVLVEAICRQEQSASALCLATNFPVKDGEVLLLGNILLPLDLDQVVEFLIPEVAIDLLTRRCLLRWFALDLEVLQ